jgi:serine/threonine protein kinase
MTSSTPSTPQAPRNDGEAIDWANVAVETTVMLRLQEAPPVAAARSRRRDSSTLAARIDAVKRKCATGYSCGASCISMSKVCRKAPGAGPAQQKMKRILALAEPGLAIPATAAPSEQTAEPKQAQPAPAAKAAPAKGYDVAQEFEQSTEILGETMTAAVKLTKGPPPGVVKKGRIGENEAEILGKLADSGVTPQLLGVSITGKFSKGIGTVLSANGLLAMSQMKGVPYEALQFTASDKEVVKASEEYVRVRKKIHSEGVAHNDMHPGNFFYDQKTGKGGLVDFGLSEIGYRGALLEALGTLDGKDFQAKRIGISKDQSPMIAKLSSNIDRVRVRMEKEHGIKGEMPSLRSSKKKVDAYLGSLSDDQARRLVAAIYEGL